MADDERSEARHLALWQALSSSPFAFDFYEALRRIECALPKRPRIGEARRVQEDAVRFGQEPSLAFATSTLAAFIPGDQSRAPRLTQNFFGLMGPNGPLPLHLTEFARDRLRNHGDSTFVRFLDVFHHRLISLFYRTWARAQPTVNLDRGESDRFSLYVGALIGLASQSTRGRDSVPDASKLSFAGLLGRQSRNAEGIESILRNFFRVPVKVEPFSAHWMMVPEELYTRLGRSDGALLGQTTVIGAKVWDLQSKFRIVIGALNLFCADARTLSAADVGTGQAMADVATMGILAQRTVHQSELLAAQLEHALSSRIAIEQAKGVLAERRHITVDQAFDQLRSHARRNNLRLSDLAGQVADGSATGFEGPRVA